MVCTESMLLAAVERLRRVRPKEKTVSACSVRRASVLALLLEEPSIENVAVWLTKRSQFVSRHKGEVCLPGGKWEEGDQDDIQVALREANEEIGLDPSAVDVVTCWPFMLLHLDLEISVVVGTLKPEYKHFQPILNQAECAAAFIMPLKCFLTSLHHTHEDCFETMEFVGQSNVREEQNDSFQAQRVRRVHSFEYFDKSSNETYNVWGLTASIMIEVSKIALDQTTDFDCYGDGPNLEKIVLEDI